MSEIAGFVAAQQAPGDQPWLKAGESLLSQQPRSEVGRWQQGAVSVAYAAVRPVGDRWAVAARGPVRVFVAGAVYGLSDAPADEVLERYLAGGLEALTDHNGACLLGVWDERDRRLHLLTDRMGIRKLYYAAVPGALRFASELKALLADPRVSRAVDTEAITHLLSFGHLLGERTLYQSIRLLRGGSVLTYEQASERVTVRRYWEPRYTTAATRLSLEECADEFAGRLKTAVARRTDGVARIGIPLSGGLDSRTLLGLTRALRPSDELRTFSTGHRHTYDVVFARRMARICRTRHRFLEIEQDYLAKRASAFVWLTDGMVNVHHAWQMALTELIPSTCEQLLVGYLGGPLTAYHPQLSAVWQERPQVIEDTFVRVFRNVCSEQQLGTLLQPAVFRQVQGAAEEECRRSLREAVADEPIDRTPVALLLHDQQRAIAYFFAMYGSVMSVAAPFADHGVMDFLLTVPARYRVQRQVLKQVLLRHLPRLAHVAVDSTGLPLDAGAPRKALHKRWKQLVKHDLPRWSGGLYRWHDRRQYAHYNEWMRLPSMRAFLQETLTRAGHHLEPWFDLNGVRQLVARHLSGDADVYRQVSALLTLMLWFEQAEQISAVRERR